MVTQTIPDRPAPRFRGQAPFVALVATLLLFGPFYLPRVLETLYRHVAIDPMFPAMLGVVFGMYFHSILFSPPASYLLASGAAVALLLAGLLLARPGRLMSALMDLSIVGILAVPWVYGYQPAVSPAPGYRMLVVTQPGLLEGVTKQAQRVAEVRPCDYFLLGWSTDDTLYYREECRGAGPQVKAIAPAREEQPRVVEGSLPDVSAEGKLSAASLVRSPSWVYGPDGRLVESAEAERSGIQIKLRESGLASPSGRWVAVVARHIYGPEDVIVLSQEQEGGGV